MKLYSQISPLLGAVLFAISVGLGRQVESKKMASVSIKNLLLGSLEWLGEIGKFCVRLVQAALTPPYEGRELLRQMDEVGAKSLPLVMLAGAAIGVVLS